MRALAETFEGPIENCAFIELRWDDGRLVAA
jgi:hypothetical protein